MICYSLRMGDTSRMSALPLEGKLMSATVLDGKVLAERIEGEVAVRVQSIKQRSSNRIAPALATILVGDDPSSATYVRMKGRACERVGVKSIRIVLPQTTTTDELLAEINRLNADPGVHGILLQHPVPSQIDERRCFDQIALEKDVDGVTALGFGRMSMNEPAYGAATPAGIMRLLKHHGMAIEGKHAVVIGRSPILGKPIAAMLLNANATITVCHSRTLDLADIVRSADIVVGAVGKPRFIRGSW